MRNSYKRNFRCWRAVYDKQEDVCFSHLSDVIAADRDLSVGEMVMFTNDAGVVFGPYEVLAFGRPDHDGRCVYLDKESYWFPVRPDRLVSVGQIVFRSSD